VISGGTKPGMVGEAEFNRIQTLVREKKMEGCTIFPGLLHHRDNSLQRWYAAPDVVVVPNFMSRSVWWQKV